MPFEDNHLGLLRTSFKTYDGNAPFSLGRLTLLVAISGGRKSVLMKFAENVFKSEKVKKAFGCTVQACFKRLSTYDFCSAAGANLEGLLEHAKKENEPAGLPSIQKENVDAVAKL